MNRPARLCLALVPLALLAQAPATLSPDVQKALNGRTAAPRQQCINETILDGPAVYDGALIYGSGRRIYLNRFDGGCRFLQQEDAVRVDILSGHLCRGDFVTPFVASTGIVRPQCVLGWFEPYDRAPKPDRGRGPRGR